MASRALEVRLARRAERAGVTLSASLAGPLLAYFELLQRWNRRINLTALTDEDEAIDRLLLEPVLAATCLPAKTFSLLDVGSGGGSPAIPLKLAAPHASLVMVEARSRKAAFLREAVRALGLERASVETARLEDLALNPEFQSMFSAVSVRAVRIGVPELGAFGRVLQPGGCILLFLPSSAVPGEISTSDFTNVAVHPLLPAGRSFLLKATFAG